jgi:hypothetical protein
MSLYGMMNWIYTWYKPRLDPDADALADHMSDLFLGGILAGASGSARWPRSRNGRRRTLAA